MALTAAVLAQGVMGGSGVVEEVEMGNRMTLTASHPHSGRTRRHLSLIPLPVVVEVAGVAAAAGEDLTTIHSIPGTPTILTVTMK